MHLKKTFTLFTICLLAFTFITTTSFTEKNNTKLKVVETDTVDTVITWLSWEEAMELNKTNPKKIFVDVYTDWCGWCKKMDAGTFMDKDVVAYMSKNYYSIKLDAERKKEIVFRGDTFRYVANGRRGYHQFAAAVLDNKMSYPSFVAFNEKVQRITVLPGYMEAPQILPILNYIGEEKYLTTKYEDFIKTWKK